MTALLIVIGDSVIAVLAASITVVTISGGGVFEWAGVRVSARSIGNPLVALLLSSALRWWLAPTLPFFVITAVTPRSLEHRSLALVESAVAKLSALSTMRAVSIVVVLSATVLMVKLSIIFGHPGFITGDDVEIQEMTLGHLLGKSWSIWDLRSAAYPMTIVYPAQVLAHALGTADTGALVSAGRSAAAALSTGVIAALFLAVRRHAGIPQALVAATFASASHLLMTFGASELPRPVSAVLIVVAFASLLRCTSAGAAAAGLLVGVAATFRFSEVVFIVPAVAQLGLERRRQHLVIFITAFVVAAAAIQLTADVFFWGEPLHSLKAIIQYTLIDRESSRGFEPPWQYAWDLTSWTDPVVAALALAASSRRMWRPALWAWSPVLLLSLLPHKEARYLVPVLPFVAMLAAIKVWEVAEHTMARPRECRARAAPIALALCVVVTVSLLYGISRFHVRRSDDAVRLAQSLAAARDIRGLAVEQLWRMGGRLYLGDVLPLEDLDPGSVATPGGLIAAVANRNVNLIALRTETCTSRECDAALATQGFRERQTPVHSDYRLFERIRP
jgi:hypothetical protein